MGLNIIQHQVNDVGWFPFEGFNNRDELTFSFALGFKAFYWLMKCIYPPNKILEKYCYLISKYEDS